MAAAVERVEGGEGVEVQYDCDHEINITYNKLTCWYKHLFKSFGWHIRLYMNIQHDGLQSVRRRDAEIKLNAYATSMCNFLNTLKHRSNMPNPEYKKYDMRVMRDDVKILQDQYRQIRQLVDFNYRKPIDYNSIGMQYPISSIEEMVNNNYEKLGWYLLKYVKYYMNPNIPPHKNDTKIMLRSYILNVQQIHSICGSTRNIFLGLRDDSIVDTLNILQTQMLDLYAIINTIMVLPEPEDQPGAAQDGGNRKKQPKKTSKKASKKTSKKTSKKRKQ